MANIKDLKKKIKSTKGTLKITSAMKLVSAAKLAKAQQAILNSRPFSYELSDTIKTISALTQDYSHPYFQESKNNKTVLLVISSNKGLCGGYNAQIIKAVKKYLKETDEDVKVYFIGKKAKDILETEVNFGKIYRFEKFEPSYLEIKQIGQELANLFVSGEVGKVKVAFNFFKSAILFEPTISQVLPMAFPEGKREELQNKFPFDFKYDPSPEEILEEVVPESYTTSLWSCLLDALASEHGSRMAAMDNAVSNSKDMIKRLTLKMNKLRQASITTELIEVVSGAESLKG